jgi:acyl dehydratase
VSAPAKIRPGLELGPSRWVEIDQGRIDGFAGSTGDTQWIHTDPARAAHGPFGGTVAHGFLTLSLLPELWFELAGNGGYAATVNYGVDRVRFPAPVPAGSRVRARFTVEEVDEVDGGEQARIAATVERDGSAKPVCVAQLLFRFLR